MRTKLTALCIAMALTFIVAGCASQVQQFQDMSPKEKATFFMKVYNGQFDNYQAQSTNPDLTDEQKKMLKVKYDLLKTMWPLVNAYNMVVDAGSTPGPQTEQELLNLIDQLAAMAI